MKLSTSALNLGKNIQPNIDASKVFDKKSEPTAMPRSGEKTGEASGFGKKAEFLTHFKDNRTQARGTKLKKCDTQPDMVIFPPDALDKVQQAWGGGHCLIGCFAEKFQEEQELIVSMLGTLLYTDMLKRTKEMISYARVLVEVDASKELLRCIRIKLPTGKIREQWVIYEFEPKFYSSCNALGHTLDSCPPKGSSEVGKREPSPKMNKALAKADNKTKGQSVLQIAPMDDSIAGSSSGGQLPRTRAQQASAYSSHSSGSVEQQTDSARQLAGNAHQVTGSIRDVQPTGKTQRGKKPL